jgi:hypothetical protein
MDPAKFYPVSEDLHVIANFLVARLSISVSKGASQDLETWTFLGLSNTNLPPTIIRTVATARSYTGSPSSAMCRKLSSDYKPTNNPQELTFLGSRNHPAQDSDSIRVGNDTFKGNAPG